MTTQKRHKKTLITQRLRTNLGRSVGVTAVTPLLEKIILKTYFVYTVHRMKISIASYTVFDHSFRPGTAFISQKVHTVQRLMLSKGAKRTIFYHITVTPQYCWHKTIARSGDMYRDDFGISTLVIICFGITNTSLQNSSLFEFPLLKQCLRKLKVFWTNLIYMYHLYWCFHSVRWPFAKNISEIMWYCLKSSFCSFT